MLIPREPNGHQNLLCGDIRWHLDNRTYPALYLSCTWGMWTILTFSSLVLKRRRLGYSLGRYIGNMHRYTITRTGTVTDKGDTMIFSGNPVRLRRDWT